MKRTRVLVAHWHPAFRAGLVQVLGQRPDLEVVADAGDPWELFTFVRQLNPDIVLLSEALLAKGGANLLARIRGLSENTRILVLESKESRNEEAPWCPLDSKMMVSQDFSVNEMVQLIREAMKRKPETISLAPVSGSGAGRGPQETSGKTKSSKAFGLTLRESQIVSAVVSGLSNHNIGTEFGISEDTVKHHISNIFDKMGVDNRLELALFAIHHNLSKLKTVKATGKKQDPRAAAAV